MESPKELLQQNVGFQHFRPDGQKFWVTFAQNGKGCGLLMWTKGPTFLQMDESEPEPLPFWAKVDEDPNTFEEFLEPDEYIDLGPLFTTDRIFSSKDELVDWAKQTAMKAKTYLIIKSHGGTAKKYKKLVVDDEEEEIPIKRRGPYGTKKSVYHHGHAQAARLMDEQLQQTEQFRKSQVPPRNILRFFLEQDIGCAKIYNVVANNKEEPDVGKEHGRGSSLPKCTKGLHSVLHKQ
ncbi:hypothetical protein M9H77_08770 [Catharanthus roseus]|uniref:Uncharacterized protein n=1 Tax=Catharanthus roseus TaxID=4058 RepID=A0ACC0BYV9_CATRO|nr:hypothetical protein M9H77_08770 [Catharanthus roseus]